MSERILTRGEAFELHKLNNDVMKSCGVGLFPPAVATTIERFALIGDVDTEATISRWSEMQRAKEILVAPTKTE